MNGKLNLSLFDFIRESRDLGKNCKILTRNADLSISQLESHGLHRIIDEIIFVPEFAKKSAYIRENRNFIFVDDSHRERIDVKLVFRRQSVVLDPSFCLQ